MNIFGRSLFKCGLVHPALNREKGVRISQKPSRLKYTYTLEIAPVYFVYLLFICCLVDHIICISYYDCIFIFLSHLTHTLSFCCHFLWFLLIHYLFIICQSFWYITRFNDVTISWYIIFSNTLEFILTTILARSSCFAFIQFDNPQITIVECVDADS